MSPISEKITIVVKTFERPDLIHRCVASIRALYARLPVIVADDSATPTSFDDDPYTKLLPLPFDSGISYGRNRALEAVETPYYLLIDDDHCFEKDCNFEDLVSVLETTDIDIIAMRMLDYRAGKKYSRGELIFAGTMNIEDGILTHRVGETCGDNSGMPLYDLVLNCYLAKKESTSEILFDENIKIGKEHGDYFLQAKEKGLKITVAKNSFIHHKPTYSKKYKKFRKRSDDFKKIFFSKHNLLGEETVGTHYYISNYMSHFLNRLIKLF